MNRFTPSSTDVHQHLWTDGFVAALRARRRPPRLRGWTLELPGEPDFRVDPAEHDIATRAAQARADGVDLALIGLSSPLGIELLPAAEAEELLAAYHEGVRSLPAPFSGWAAASVDRIDPAALARELDAGMIGLQLPAAALHDGRTAERVGPLLELVQARDRPLFVHPGPALTPRGAPGWWAGVVLYVAQMHAAWHGFLAHARARHPRLRVCFAMLAGLAPLHSERARRRGAPAALPDERLFLEVSCYGPRAIDATVRAVGLDALVYGTDRPYGGTVASGLGAAAEAALRVANPARLLTPDPREARHAPVVPARP